MIPCSDSLIYVATRSYVLPTSSPNGAPFNTMDLGLHLDMPETSTLSDSTVSNQWEQWGEESTIELVMLTLRANPAMLSAGAGRPSVPAQYPAIIVKVTPSGLIKLPGSRLTSLRFCVVPPDIVPPSPTITRDPRRPVKDGLTEKGNVFLLASFLDFADCECPNCCDPYRPVKKSLQIRHCPSLRSNRIKYVWSRRALW